MLNDRDDKYEAPEESEYHFSDDEVSYEVEPEATKAETVAEPKQSPLKRLAQSKRMLISLVVFLVLVFIVYKMVAPSSTAVTAPSTDISPPAPQASQATSNQVAPPNTVSPPRTNAYPGQQPTTNMQAPAQTMTGQLPQQGGLPPQQQLPPPQQQAMMPAQTQVPAAMPPREQQSVYPQQSVVNAQQQMNQQQQVMPPTTPQQMMPPQEQQQQPPQGYYANQPEANLYAPQMAAQLPAPVDARIANVASENARLVGQLQTEYVQRVTEFANQNKNLQDQVQALNNRMAAMESQLNQLVQVLTRQAPVTKTVVVRESPPAVEQKIAYTVQAIIPGRAWLKSDNGETITVAEGDMIKNLGRVVKIDPYDGVVQINTGNRVISLSYGAGG